MAESVHSAAEDHPPTEPGRLTAFLQEVLDRQFDGIKQSLAEALGLSGSRLGRVLRGEFSLSVLSCLRLAKVTGRSASEVLEAADKEEIARLLEELYGPAVVPISNADRQLLDRWHALRPDSQRTLLGLINELGQAAHGQGARHQQ